MKTKHLLTAMVLPALFAACTNDELASIGQNAETMNGRKMAGNVTLSFDLENNADTRLAYGSNGYTWEKDDQIGACLMDEISSNYNAANKTWSERFDLTNYIQTNYKFTRDAEGKWNTEAKLCEGNYFFCYPYNANMGLRDAYEFNVASQTMTNTTTEALQEAFAKNNAFMGFSKVVASDAQVESLGIDMVSVFGATGFTLKNTGTETYKIEKIVLRGTDVISSATLNPITCTKLIQYNSNEDATSTEFNVAQYVGDGSDVQYVDNFYAYNKTSALRDVLDYGTGSSVEVVLTAGNVVKSNQSISVIAMMANKAITTGGAILDIYTDKGMIRNIDLSKRYTANSTGATTTNVLTDVALASVGSGNKVKVTFDDTSIDVPSELEVYSNDDLASLIHWNATVATPITATLKADVTITKAMYDELAASQITTATLSGAKVVTIAADVPAAALDRFTYTSVSKIIVKGTQTLTSTANTTAAIEVAKGATLNVNGNAIGAAQVASITNNGTLNVNANLTAATTNNATMSIAAGKTVSALTNKGTVTNAGVITTLTNNAPDLQKGLPAAITNTGTVVGGTNAGTITNNEGKVTVTTNTGTIYANGKSATVISTTNSGAIVITKLDSDGNFKVPAVAGAIVQELASASTKDVDTRANTVWLTGALKVDPNKNVDGVMQAVENLQNVTIYAKSAGARIDGNGKTQPLVLTNIKIAESSTLVINNVMIGFKAAATIVMEGKARKIATLTINSNAAYGNKVTLPTADTYNIVNDYTNK